MEKEALKKIWLQEEEAAHIHGWDFSHINGKYDEERDLPWNYRETVGRYLKPDMKLLDLDTGGGEFLLSLGHPCGSLAATVNYPPNAALCREKLLPLGIDFRQADSGGRLPFDSGSFDMIINRHGNFNPDEISRTLKPGGIFVTEQVGAENDRELVALLLKDVPELPFPEQYLEKARADRFTDFFWLQKREGNAPSLTQRFLFSSNKFCSPVSRTAITSSADLCFTRRQNDFSQIV